MYRYLAELMDTEGIYAEPSALTGFYGPLLSSKVYDLPETAVHVIWSTGGNMVPLEVREADYRTGKGVLLNP